MIIIFDFRKLSINSLAIPDTYCSMDKETGYQCPKDFECVRLNISKYTQGFAGFDDFGNFICKNLRQHEINIMIII